MTHATTSDASKSPIPDLKNTEQALKAGLAALDIPLDATETKAVRFKDLFDLHQIQHLQDQFANATGVASIITRPDGTPITRPSNFCRLCSEIIRKTEKGRKNCYKSDAAIGRFSDKGPTIQPCISGGLWDAGAAISVGGRHIANWLVGQVRDNTQTEQKIREYAKEIGADEITMVAAFLEVPAMDRNRFEQIARMLFTLANQLSTIAYQSFLQALQISELRETKSELAEYQTHLENMVKKRTEALSAKNRELQQKIVERKNLQVKLSHAVDIARLGPWEYDFGEDRFTLNDHFYKILRTTAKDVGGYTMTSAEFAEHFVHPDDMPLFKRKLQDLSDAVDAGYGRDFEYRMRYADGETGHIVARRLRVKDAKGRLVKAYGVIQDITEQHRLETQLQQAQKMESIGRLAGGVAHDYNNMLGVIIGHVELALEKVVSSDPVHLHLKAILDASRRSSAITRQLLAFARKQTIQPKTVDLNEAVSNMLKMLRQLIGEQIDLAWRPVKNLWPVRMDPSQIDQILANLCVNARDAIQERGKIMIETGMVTLDEAYCKTHVGFKPGDFVLLAVSDNGCGMDRETVDKVFEPFFTTKEHNNGTGLGLATVYGIVKQNNGYINVYSEPEKGSTFKVYLPRHDGATEETKTISGAEIPPGRGETVLVVEDEGLIIEMAERILERLGYSVLTAESPLKALEVAELYAGEIDLLITDVVMPEMNGRELAMEIRARYPSINTLFMSGYTANVIVHQGVLDPGVHFLQKPFSIRDLASKVQEALDGR
jgi:signal transduction histidine kinase/CheY-like chemotaxis protein